MALDLDFETFCELNVRTVGAYRYASHPSCEVLVLCYSIDNGPVRRWVPYADGPDAPPRPLPRALRRYIEDTDGELIAHNSQFEMCIWHYVMERLHDAPPIAPHRWVCTAAMAAACGLPRSLDGAAMAMQLQHQKNKEGARLLNIFAKPRKPTKLNKATRTYPWDRPDEFEKLCEYCEDDVRAEAELYERLPKLSKYERRVFAKDIEMNSRGLPLDVRAVKTGFRLLTELERRNKNRVEQLTGGIRATQRDKMLEHFKSLGVELENLQAKTIRDLITAQKEILPDAAVELLLLRIEGGKASTKKLKKMLEVMLKDGRVRGAFLYWGAHCVPGDTEVLTRSGWVPIKDWDGKSEIAQVNEQLETQFLPGKKFVGPVADRWLQVRTEMFTGDFTLGHTMPYFHKHNGSFQYEKAGVFATRARRSVPVSTVMPSTGALNAVQMRVLTMVQADGHFAKGKNQGMLLFTFKKERKIERCQKLLAEAGIPCRVRGPYASGNVAVKISRKDVPHWLTEERKSFGPWVLDSTPAARLALIEEAAFWDGCTDPRNEFFSYSYSTTDPVSAEWLQTVAHLTGYRSSITMRDRGREGWKDSYRVHVWQGNSADVREHHMAVVTERRKTYCAETQTGYWLARHNGHIFVTGNTGRYAGKLIQPQNFTRGEYTPYQQWLLFQHLMSGDADVMQWAYRWPIDAIAQAMRGFVRAPRGKKFVVVDFSAIEARVLAWIAGEEKTLNLYRLGADLYKRLAVKLYKLNSEAEVQDWQRKFAKDLFLGAGYQLGWAGFVKQCFMRGIVVDPEEAKAAIKTYRDDNPNIVRLWYDVERAAVRAVEISATRTRPVKLCKLHFYCDDVWFCIRLPSGRVLRYVYPRIEHGERFGKPVKKLTYRSEFKGKWIRESTYGGKLVENLVQAIARDLMVNAWFNAEDEGYEVIGTVHDELITEVDRDFGSPHELEEILRRKPDWADDAPINAEGWEGVRYRK